MASQGTASLAAGDEISALKERILLLEKELVESENTHRLRYNMSNQLTVNSNDVRHCYCSRVKRIWLMCTLQGSSSGCGKAGDCRAAAQG